MPDEKEAADEQELTDEELERVPGGTDRFNGKYLVQGVTHTHTQPTPDDGFVDKLKIRE